MNLLKTVATVSGVTLVSRVLGFVRDVLIARIFGADFATDAFYVAFKLPNLLRRIFAEGAFSQAFVPILVEHKNTHEQAETRQFLDRVAGALTLALFVITVIGVIAAPIIIFMSAPGFAASPDKLTMAVTMLRITFPYIFLISLSSLASGILNTYGSFSVSAFTPTFLNLAFIGCSLWLTPYIDPPIYTLAWAVLIGGLLQLGYQLPYLRRLNALPIPKLNLRDNGVARIASKMVPAILGVSVSQISLVINTIFASFLVSGSVSWMYNADRLMEFPTGLLGVALGTILIPSLSKHYANQLPRAYSDLLDWGLRLCIVISVPAGAAIACISLPLVTTLFLGGKFSAVDAQMTHRALLGYSIGLPALIAVKVLAPAFFSRQDVKTPARAAVISLLATQACNIFFLLPLLAERCGLQLLAHAPAWLEAVWGLQHAGLALSISIGATVNAAILYLQLRRLKIYLPMPGWLTYLGKIALATVGMSATVLAMAGSGNSWLIQRPIAERLLHLTPLILAGVAVYFCLLWILGIRPSHFARREI